MSLLVSPSVAFLTVSYAPDHDRCALLSRSLRALAPSVQHYIVVDHADRRHFASLESSRTTLLTTEEVLPVRVHRVKTRGLWTPIESVGPGARQADPWLARATAREARAR